jgi:hypothetical protein
MAPSSGTKKYKRQNVCVAICPEDGKEKLSLCLINYLLRHEEVGGVHV